MGVCVCAVCVLDARQARMCSDCSRNGAWWWWRCDMLTCGPYVCVCVLCLWNENIELLPPQRSEWHKRRRRRRILWWWWWEERREQLLSVWIMMIGMRIGWQTHLVVIVTVGFIIIISVIISLTRISFASFDHHLVLYYKNASREND